MAKHKRSEKRSETGEISALPDKDNKIFLAVSGFLKDKGKRPFGSGCNKTGSRHDEQGVFKLDGSGAVRTEKKEQGKTSGRSALTPPRPSTPSI